MKEEYCAANGKHRAPEISNGEKEKTKEKNQSILS